MTVTIQNECEWAENVEQTDIDYLRHKKICGNSKFFELFILVLDTAFESFNGKAGIYHFTIHRKCPNSIKYQSSTFAVQGTQLHNLVLCTYSIQFYY